jgi:hypothetical protein
LATGAVPIAVGAGERGDDVVGGMRDERRVVIGEQHTLVLEELQQPCRRTAAAL